MYPVFLSRTLLVSLATLGFSSLIVIAVPVPAYNSGEIIIGFRASGGPGGDQAYLVKIGPASQFTTASAGSSFTLNSIQNIGLDLAAVYGADWHTRGNLLWGAFGTTDSVAPTLYVSKKGTNPATPSTPYPELVTAARTGTKTEILSVTSGTTGSYDVSEATPNSPVATFQQNTSEFSSYHFQVTRSGTDFGSQSQWTSIEGDFTGGVSTNVLDLYRIGAVSSTFPTAVKNLGKFTISSAGVITFTAASAAPPSTADADGDGYTDAQEIAAGTNPNSGADFFRVQSVTPTASGISVQFNAAANRPYVIEYSETLAAGSWQTVANVSANPTAGPVQFTDTNSTRRSRPKGFYRVTVTF